MSESLEIASTFEDIDLGKLETSLRSPRTLASAVLSAIAIGASILACVPLLSVLTMLLYRGGKRISWEALTSTPPAAFAAGGGFGNAIAGTLTMVGIAALLSVPTGILAAAYLALIGPETWTASAVRFAAKVLTGMPSVLAGVFAYAAVVLVTGGFSAPAGGVALAVLMVPTVLLTAEDAIRSVPVRMKEAAIGMGATQAQLLWRVMLPTAMPGILTGVMLAVARAAGETAPLLFTALNNQFWSMDMNGPMSNLPTVIFQFAMSPYADGHRLAWGGAALVTLAVLALNILARSLFRKE